MGKLHVDTSDLVRLAELLDKGVALSEDSLQVDLGGPKLTLTDLKTEGHFEQNGIRFAVTARFSKGALDVEFE